MDNSGCAPYKITLMSVDGTKWRWKSMDIFETYNMHNSWALNIDREMTALGFGENSIGLKLSSE